MRTQHAVDKPADGPGASGELVGKVALVTGATRGLGRAIADALAEAGATVVVSSRKAEACEQVAAEITEATGVKAYPLALHVGDWDAIEPAVDAVVAEHGSIDVLVNNAGIAPLAPSAYDVTEGLFDKTIGVNLKGPFRLMAVAGRHMHRAGNGAIINISSIGAERPSPPEATYAASKNGLNAPSPRITGRWSGSTASCRAPSPPTWRPPGTRSSSARWSTGCPPSGSATPGSSPGSWSTCPRTGRATPPVR
jgi:NAD(P)-dependent dehydrogenase (short-subunit alcohol dehydrogenase family)